MHFWPEEMELLRLNSAGDSLTLKDTFNGTIITARRAAGRRLAPRLIFTADSLRSGQGGSCHVRRGPTSATICASLPIGGEKGT